MRYACEVFGVDSYNLRVMDLAWLELLGALTPPLPCRMKKKKKTKSGDGK